MMAEDKWPEGMLPVRFKPEAISSPACISRQNDRRICNISLHCDHDDFSVFAERACRAINAFDDLVEALSEVMIWIKNWYPEFVLDDEWQNETAPLVDAALAKARKQEG
jgi:hypothetical protein